MRPRPYKELIARIDAACRGMDRAAAMQVFVDIAWDALQPTGVSWLGFYFGGAEEMTLGPRRDKPACTPIGLHGVCGRAYTSRRPQVVADVATLGANYVACDPRDRSEVVIPCIDPDGVCWGVLDLDSHEAGSFGEADVRGLTGALIAAGLTSESNEA
ncbi:MAG: diguanylate cyclase [Phycisphaerae bacterium]|nr:MAG: GAF domain-containing protein [Planctomycetia bacterium]RIK69759.1 MAG: diguanylate cyclase [Planctomycetota bacterium]GJQ26137.1 MAG: diguanylate cyclase [Phycisphaerae bacterium]